MVAMIVPANESPIIKKKQLEYLIFLNLLMCLLSNYILPHSYRDFFACVSHRFPFEFRWHVVFQYVVSFNQKQQVSIDAEGVTDTDTHVVLEAGGRLHATAFYGRLSKTPKTSRSNRIEGSFLRIYMDP